MEKEVKILLYKEKGGVKVYFYILEGLKSGKNPSELAKKLGFSKQRINKYISKLKQQGYIEKISYGVWKVKKEVNLTEGGVVNLTEGIGKKRFTSFPDSTRGHAFMFKLQLPKDFRNWDRRESYLQEHNIPYEPYEVAKVKRGQKLKIKDFTIYLTNSNIIFYTKESFYAENSTESKSLALSIFIDRVKTLENLLKANFSYSGRYKFRVLRQHYALIKNALASQYNEEGKKLHVYTEKGLWLVIDNSFNLNELETLNRETADSDNKKVQDWFNGLKKYEGFTPEFLMKGFSGIISNQLIFDSNMKSHIEAVQKLGEGVANFNEQIKKLNVLIEKGLK